MQATETLPSRDVERSLVSAEGVAKAFGGVQALRGVSIDIRPGEVHGLVGANGAGKSTLIRVLAGLVQPDAGRILVDGREVEVTTPHRANELGMSFIHQELAYIPGMSVLQNIMLGLPKKTRFGFVDWAAAEREVEPLARRVGITAPLGARINGLPTAEIWLVSICRALVRKARLIVMDEPTASLSESEAEKLFAIISDLAAGGVSVLYVSHRLDEITRLCSRVTVFRDGSRVAGLEGEEITRQALVTAIVGGAVEHLSHAPRPPGRDEPVLRVEGLAREPKVAGVSFELHRGEVLGIGGLVGAGRSELARVVFGADRPHQGAMTLDGRPFAPRAPSDAVAAGLGFVPEERRSEGLVLTKSVAFNLQIANLAAIVHGRGLPLVSRRRQTALSEAIIRDLAIKTSGPDQPVGRLSGGNQQKVVIGRWLMRRPRILILDEPTRGVDIGARGEIHRLIRKLAEDGMAVLVISSEPDELPDLCDRVLVMSEGRIVRELAGSAITRNAIVEASYAEGHPAEETVP